MARRAALLPLLTVLATSSAAAQMPNVPTLQNAWANPGLTAAADFTSESGASSYGVAGAWSPGSARFQLSGGLAMQNSAGTGSRLLYGARAAFPLMGASGALGVGAFAGFGGGAGADSSRTATDVPVGVTVGWRHAAGSHGVSAYAAPAYHWVTRGGGGGSTSVLRVGVGIDVGVTPAIGATIGLEVGGTGGAARTGGTRGTGFAAAVSYAFGR